MTNEELIQDLKQFIEATVSQQTNDLDKQLGEIKSQMVTKEDLLTVEQRLNVRIDTVQDAIAETITHAMDTTTSKQVKDLETRVLRLEQQAA